MATTYENSVVARASIVSRLSGTFSAEAVLIAAATFLSPGIQSGWPGDDLAMPGNFMPAAIPYGAFTADAVIQRNYSASFSAEALIMRLTGQTFSFSADATIAVSSGNWLEATINGLTADVVCSMSDSRVVSLSIERENLDTGTWTVLQTEASRNSFFTDFTPPLNKEFRYRGRGYDSGGVLIQSITTYPYFISTTSYSADWSITDGVEELYIQVTSSSLTKELQTEVFSPLGKVFKTVQVGEQLGRKGNIEFFVESSDRRSVLATLDRIVNSTRETYLRTPFGLVLQVAFGSVSETLLPGGHSKMNMDYIENGAY